jgi:hypothetical protein
MKTSALVIMSALLLAAAGPVLAWTNQDQFACEVAQVNCPVAASNLEPIATPNQGASWSQDRFVCALAQVNCPAEAKRPEPRATAVNRGSWSQDRFVCELAQVNCPAEANAP